MTYCFIINNIMTYIFDNVVTRKEILELLRNYYQFLTVIR